MRTIRIEAPSSDGTGTDTDGTRPGPGRGPAPLLAGAATAVVAAGALLALIDSGSPLRAPCTLFFLLAAPAGAIAAARRGPDPLGRAVTALAGAIVVDLLVAQGMVAAHRWSAGGGVVAVTGFSLLVLLVALLRDRARRGRPRD
ncbi:hypothetical protein [Streptomyces sp. SCL15-4]|uniref:hypothetical protein n=1 Tax=Streptomyces sp. SCL15-4 TaxID=2967221 RepID=UPI002966FCA2|nr:hypothetical protein [Streptomyces sp. SCL15-4]